VFKNYRFKHTYNDNSDIGRRKHQKQWIVLLHVNILSHITVSTDHDIVNVSLNDEIENLM